ncbi:MAG: PKD domain-containing protein, partial [Chloroflexota bacterium]
MRRFFSLFVLSGLLLLSLLVGPISLADYTPPSAEDLSSLEAGTIPLFEQSSEPSFSPTGLHNFTLMFPTLLTVTKQVAGPLVAGTSLTYTLTVTNTSLMTNATNVVVNDTLPAGATFVSADNGGMLETGVVSWTIPSILTNSQVTVSFVVTTCQTSISNTTYQVVNTDEGFNSFAGTPVVTALVSPTIEADFTASTNQITVNDPLTFTSVVTTNGVSGMTIDWDFGDTNTDQGTTVSHSYNSIGPKNVTITATDACGFMDSKVMAISVVEPVLAVTKSDTPDPVQAGDTLTYTIVVENTGLGNATGVTVSDPVPANTTFNAGSVTLDATSGVIGSPPNIADNIAIAAGKRVTVTFSVDVNEPLNAGDLITNVVSVDNDQTAAIASATETTTVNTTPQVQVVKTGSSSVTFGQTAFYTFTVTNAGNTVLENVQVVDDFAGTASSSNADGFLGLTEVWTYTASYLVNSESVGASFTNTVTVTATDTFGTQTVATDDHTTTVDYNPAYGIEKSGPTTTQNVGTMVQYTIEISNTGGDGSAIQNVVVNDPLLGGNLTRTSGDTVANNLLEVGETWVYEVDYTIQADDADPLVNTATLTGDDLDGQAVGAIDDGHSFDINYNPAYGIEKSGPTTTQNVGTMVQYTIEISNTGGDGSAIQNVVVNDPMLGGNLTRTSGDTVANNLLEVGETWVYEVDYTIQADDADPLVNTATLNGDDLDGDSLSQASDGHSFDINYVPAYEIRKSSPTLSQDVGQQVQYTIQISNTGGDGSAIQNVVVNDPMLGGNLTRTSGDTNTNNQLDVGEIWEYVVNYTIQADDADPLVNTATLNGDDLDGDALSQASDGHSVNVNYNPAYGIEKSGPTTTQNVGTMVQYTIEISNTGGDGSAIQNVVVNDPLLGGNLTRTSGDTVANNLLEVGETWVYEVDYTIQADDADPLVNTATLNGDDLDGDALSQLTDGHSFAIEYNPVISVTKFGPSFASVGQGVEYFFEIRHDPLSDGSAIQNVTISDDVLDGAVGPPTLIQKIDGDNDDLLEAGETWRYKNLVDYVIPETTPNPLVNTVTASGEDLDGDAVSPATYQHSLDVNFNAAIDFEKTGPTFASIGETIIFTFEVRTAGDNSSLSNVVVTDTLGISVVSVGGAFNIGDTNTNDKVDVNETWIYTAAYTIPPDATSPLLNSGVVVAQDGDLNDVTASDSHFTLLQFNPRLSLDKTGPTLATVNQTIVYTFEVS